MKYVASDNGFRDEIKFQTVRLLTRGERQATQSRVRADRRYLALDRVHATSKIENGRFRSEGQLEFPTGRSGRHAIE